jgi:ferredoxin-NADP reductase
MRVTGIAGDIFYTGDSMFMVRKEGVLQPQKITKVGMIAAGSGLTPMF